MIRLIYWLLKRRWAICKECKHGYFSLGSKPLCKKTQFTVTDFIKGSKQDYADPCDKINKSGVCWGFKEKAEV
jgi:hypothetical protein